MAGEEHIDTSGLVETLNTIAAMDEVAAASSSSTQLDTWIANLSEWQTYLSQSENLA